MSNEYEPPLSQELVRWLLKVIQPDRTLAALPGGAGFDRQDHARLLGLPADVYAAELARMQEEASAAADELLADPSVSAMVDGLPLREGAVVVAFGDSLTADPQSWAVILGEVLARRRGDDRISLVINAVAGETTTHGLVRIARAIDAQPDWMIFLIGTNDARSQGPHAGKTLVAAAETRRNIAELRRRVSRESSTTDIWVTPPAVDEAMVARHAGLAGFGVRFRNRDVERVATIIRESGASVIDAFDAFGMPPAGALLEDDGLHLTVQGQKRMALEVLRGWSGLA